MVGQQRVIYQTGFQEFLLKAKKDQINTNIMFVFIRYYQTNQINVDLQHTSKAFVGVFLFSCLIRHSDLKIAKKNDPNSFFFSAFKNPFFFFFHFLLFFFFFALHHHIWIYY